MARIRYTGDAQELIVQPEGTPPFVVTRREWVEVDANLAKRLAQQPDWEIESTKGARAKTDKENS